MPDPSTTPHTEVGELAARAIGIQVREIRHAERTADFVASTDTVDSFDEVVDQGSWRLERFKRNPIALWAHQSRELPIGICTRCEVVAGKLECTIRFVTEDKNPKAEQVWKMVRDGEIKAVSVGFMPHTVRWEKRNDVDVYVLSDNELHEISVCNIPANPDALAKMKAKALADAGQAPHNDGSWSPRARRSTDPETIHPAGEGAGGQEKTMSNERQLQDALAAKDKEIATLRLDVKLANEDAKGAKDLAIAAADRAAAAEERAKSAEDRAVASDTRATTVEAAHKEAMGKIAVARDLLAAKEDEDIVAAAQRAAHDRVVAEVEKLVGVKIAPFEREDFVELAKTNRALYERMVAGRKDLGIAGRVIERSNDSPATPRERAGNDAGAELNELLEKSMATPSGIATDTPDLADLLG